MDTAALVVFGACGAVVAALVIISIVVVGGGAAVRLLRLPVDLPLALRFLPPPPPVRPPGDAAGARVIAERQARLIAIHARAMAASEPAPRGSEVEAQCRRTAAAAVTADCAARALAAAHAADSARALPEEQAVPEIERQCEIARVACGEAEAAMGPVYRNNLHLWLLAGTLVILLALLWVLHPQLGPAPHALP